MNKSWLKLLDRSLVKALLIGIAAAFSISIVEYLFAAYLQLLFTQFGYIQSELPKLMLPFRSLGFSQICLILIGFGVLRAIATFLSQYGPNKFHDVLLAKLRSITVHQILLGAVEHAPDRAEVNYRFAEMYPKATDFLWLFLNSVVALIQVVSLMVLMLYIAPYEAVVGLAGLGTIGFALHWINKKITSFGAESPLLYRRITTGIERISHNRLLVHVSGMREREFNSMTQELRHYSHYASRSRELISLGSVLPQAAGTALLAVILYLDKTKEHTAYTLSFLYLFMRFSQQVGGLVSSLTSCSQFWPHFKETGKGLDKESLPTEILAIDRAVRENFGNLKPSSSNPSQRRAASNLVFENVGFAWSPQSRKLFQNVDLDISSGQALGVIGPSGVGKSSFLALLFGMVLPTEGKITIDGKSPADFVSETHQNIGYVGPDSFLFHASLRENLLYGLDRQSVSDDAIWQMLKDLGLEQDVRRFPAGLGLVITDNFCPFSTGQKQRLAIARALLKNPCMLVLDEATSNLDIETEKEVIRRLLTRRESCTMIIVSHRKAILEMVDQVLDLSHQSKTDRAAAAQS